MLDFEMNGIDKENQEVRAFLKREIIEIGAVMMDDEFQITSHLNCYIKPEYSPIAENIESLTGISNETVAKAKDFKNAMAEFLDWIGDGDVTVYSWSEHDYNQLKKECDYKKVTGESVDRLFSNWVDFQKEFGELLGIEKKIALNDAVSAAELSFEGTEHNALCDALNTAYILQLSKNKAEFEQVMKPIIEIFRPAKGTGVTLGDLIPKDLLLSLPE